MTDEELRGLFDAIRQETVATRAESSTLREEAARAREENSSAHVETRRHFDVALETARHEIRLVAEGVADTRELLTREVSGLREEVRRSAAETQAMIKFSHAELQRRVETLEEAMSDLQARVGRLESITQ